MNEKKKKVIYLCASKQLVEQTAKEANELGIKVSTYTSGKYTKEFYFDECKAPLVTTYQALFHGKSRFKNKDLGGIIFDDSHVSGSVLKNSFTLSLPRDSSLYTQIANLFISYFDSQNKDVRYNQILKGTGEEVFILPSFEVKHHLETIKKILIAEKVSEHKNLKYPWEYLKDNLDMCLFLINSKRIEIVPPIIPSKNLSYFGDDVSRVYLSATHVGMDYFPRYYGNKINHYISFSSGKSKSKKFIISPYKTNISIDDIYQLRKLVFKSLENYRALIITPSFKKGEVWKKLDVDSVLDTNSENIIENIYKFKNSTNKKLVLANRYDGIDFPGETCRVLVFGMTPIN